MSSKETNQLLLNFYKKEELKKIRNWQEEGKKIDEIIELANKDYITVDEIKETVGYYEEDEITEVEEIETKETEKSEVVNIEIEKLEDYPNQPFNLYDEDKKQEMIESIRINGIMQPLIVRPLNNGNYQILAGHNRKNCAKEIGIKSLPCIIKNNLSNDEAMIYLIDTNLCTRDRISVMERARAYKLKYDTYKKRNIESSMIEEIKKDNIGTARASIIAEEKSSNGSVQRYLRLNYLIPALQEEVEEGTIGITVGEKLSFLAIQEQENVGELIKEKIKITDKIAQRIKKQSEKIKKEDIENIIDKDEMLEIIKPKKKTEENITDTVAIIFYKDEIEAYFVECNTKDEIKSYIIKILEEKTYRI